MRTNLLPTVWNYTSGIRLGYAVQLKMKAWSVCKRRAEIGRVNVALQPYRLYDMHTLMFKATCSSKEEYALRFERLYCSSKDVIVVQVRMDMRQCFRTALNAAGRQLKLYVTLNLQFQLFCAVTTGKANSNWGLLLYANV